jgi:hypothetical protein
MEHTGEQKLIEYFPNRDITIREGVIFFEGVPIEHPEWIEYMRAGGVEGLRLHPEDWAAVQSANIGVKLHPHLMIESEAIPLPSPSNAPEGWMWHKGTYIIEDEGEDLPSGYVRVSRKSGILFYDVATRNAPERGWVNLDAVSHHLEVRINGTIAAEHAAAEYGEDILGCLSVDQAETVFDFPDPRTYVVRETSKGLFFSPLIK